MSPRTDGALGLGRVPQPQPQPQTCVYTKTATTHNGGSSGVFQGLTGPSRACHSWSRGPPAHAAQHNGADLAHNTPHARVESAGGTPHDTQPPAAPAHTLGTGAVTVNARVTWTWSRTCFLAMY